MSTVSWISTSVAPSARARAMSVSRTSRPLRCTRAAIASSAFIFGETGALFGVADDGSDGRALVAEMTGRNGGVAVMAERRSR